MLIRISTLFVVIFVSTSNIKAADIHIPCEYVTWIEVVKSPPKAGVSESFRGTCRINCFMLGIHLTRDGLVTFYDKLPDIVGQAPDIYIGKELIRFGITFHSVPPIEFFEELADISAFSTYAEAEARASAICAEKPVKYTGILGEHRQNR